MEPIPVRFLDVKNLPVTSPDPALESYAVLLSPDAVHVRISGTCNLSCDFCERMSWLKGDKETEPDMPLHVWEAIRDKFLPHSSGAEFAGLGEPTIVPLFAQAAAETVAMGKVLYFPTNGYTLGAKKILDCVGETPRVSVSLDAWDEASYKEIRTGDWDRVISNIRKFRAAKPNAHLHSQYTAGAYNIDGFAKFMQVLVDEGFNSCTMRFVHAHTVDRERVSLRFAKDRTEKAIYEAQLIAEKAGLPLIIERRPYSEFQPQSIEDTSPTARLARYLDFVPMEDPACPSGCVTSTITSVSTIFSVVYTDTVANQTYSTDITSVNSIIQITCTDSLGTCITITQDQRYGNTAYDQGDLLHPFINNSNNYYLVSCVNSTCETVSGTIIGPNCTITSGFTVMGSIPSAGGPPSTIVISSTTFPLSTVCGPISATCPAGTTILSNVPATTIISYSCSCFCSTGFTTIFSNALDSVGTCSFNKVCSGSTVTQGTCIVGMADDEGGGPEIVNEVQAIKSVVQPRGAQFEAMSVGAVEKPIQGTPAAIICWWDGKLTTCFANHEVGNVLTNTWEEVIKNPRYQAFLHRRSQMNGMQISEEPWCSGCSRVH